MLELVMLLSALGVVTGLLSSLLGVGGACIVVPVLGVLLQRHGFRLDIAQRMALATSLASIALTAVSSVWGHMRLGAMRWDIWRRMIVGIVLGTLAGSLLASHLPALVLKSFFALLVTLTAIPLWKVPRPRACMRSPVWLHAGAVALGCVSGLAGLAGSMMTILFLAATGLTWNAAVCTGSALSLPISFSGVAGFIIGGWTTTTLAQGCLGYVNLPALVALVIPSALTALLGARLAHRADFPIDILRKAFAVLSVVLVLWNLFL